MWGKFWPAFVVALTVGVTVLTAKVDAQSTVDESASCESSTLEKAVNYIGEGLKDVRLVKEELTDVKKTLGSNQVVNLIAEGFEEVKNILGSIQQQQNSSSCSSSKQQSRSADLSISKQIFASSLESNCIPMLIQQNINASSTFNRSWAEYKAGFNDTRGNYWLGNDLLSQLTQSRRYKLRFDLQHRNGSWYWAEYSSFVVLNETYLYKLQVSGYSGNTGHDALGYHDQLPFSTWDRDHDLDTLPGYCAAYLGGGFWYKNCFWCGINNSGSRSHYYWYIPSARLYLQKSRMWLTC